MILVEGCDCGGWLNHRADCCIWELPSEQARAAITAADDRWAEHLAGLSRIQHILRSGCPDCGTEHAQHTGETANERNGTGLPDR